jgi:hypothetical protein
VVRDAAARVDVRRRSEEALAVEDLDNVGVVDLAVGLTGDDLEKVSIGADRRAREPAELSTRQFLLGHAVLDTVDLDVELPGLPGFWVMHFSHPDSFNLDTVVSP